VGRGAVPGPPGAQVVVYPGAVRRWTLVTIVVLLVVMVGAAIWQGVLVTTNDPRPGEPVTPTTPLP
jgi:hypothetical protein